MNRDSDDTFDWIEVNPNTDHTEYWHIITTTTPDIEEDLQQYYKHMHPMIKFLDWVCKIFARIINKIESYTKAYKRFIEE